MDERIYADLILPLALPGTYTFEVPPDKIPFIEKGKRVVVQFGRGTKHYTAIVNAVHSKKPQSYTPKPIVEILDEIPIVNEIQLQFWRWLADYYMCYIGEVMIAALPAGLRLASESRFFLIGNPAEGDELTEKESKIIIALRHNPTLTLAEISDILQIVTVQPILNQLIQRGIIAVHETLKKGYKPKTEKFVQLSDKFKNEAQLRTLFAQLEKAPKQLDLLLQYTALSQWKSENPLPVLKSILLKTANASAASYKALETKGVFDTIIKEVNRLEDYEKTQEEKKLSAAQTKAYDEIKNGFQGGKPVLLHGVTSSGKTEIYVKLINETLERGEQVLYLLPEIALTTHIISRLQKYFGERIGVYHSRFNENERIEVWQEVLHFGENENGRFHIILGARSAMFLPFKKLGLIIIDESHEGSFKQYNPAPRYHARDAAIVLSTIHRANVLLGSATPSIESYYNAETGKYHLVKLTERYGKVQLPEIFCADLKSDMRKKKMQSNFSEMLSNAIQEALDNKEQVILFQNRRGYAPLLICEVCGHIPQCKNCDVSLTYHKKQNMMRCHHCGYTVDLHSACEACGSHRLSLKGFGTEQIEEDLGHFFPKAKIGRLDWDTTRAKNAYANILQDFELRKIDILVGTQMVSKGLDFANVSLVGILNADSIIHYPDFRSFERAFQLMSQVAGRAGRKSKRGKVIIQSFQPQQEVIKQVIDNDYMAMYNYEILQRRNFLYPPFVKLCYFTVKHKNALIVQQAAGFLSQTLKKTFGSRVLGPEYCLIPRLQQYYQMQITLKIDKKISLSKAKARINEILHDFEKQYRARVIIDIDPL